MSFTDHYEVWDIGKKRPAWALACNKCTDNFGEFPTIDAAVEEITRHFRKKHPEIDIND